LIPRALALALAIVVLALLLTAPHIDTQAQGQVEVNIRWVTYINPTDGLDEAYGVCVFGNYIAVVGDASDRPYVALLRKSDGGVVREWIGREEGGFSNCISIGGKLYAVGYTKVGDKSYGVIYVFDENLNVLARVRSGSPSVYFSLAYDGKALYIGGWAYEDVNGDGKLEHVWLVEKRALDTSLSLVSSRKIYFSSWRWGVIIDIGVDPSIGRIWAVGFYYDSDDIEHSLIVILDGDLRELKRIDYHEGSDGYLGGLHGIAFDGRYAYISGGYGVAKFTVDGELVAANRDGKAGYKIVYGYNYLYTFANAKIGGYVRHVLYVRDTDLDVVKGYVLSENVNANSYFYPGRPALEGNNIYVAGIDYAPGGGNTRVVVYSLSISIVESTTVTVTRTVTTTVTTTVPTTTTVTTTATRTTTTTTTTTATTTVPTTTTVTTTVPTTTTTTTTVTTTVPTTTTTTTTVITTTTLPITTTLTTTTTTTTTVPTTLTTTLPTTTTTTVPTTLTTTIPTTTTITTMIPTTTTMTVTTPITRNITVTTTATATVTKVDTATVSVPTTVTITTTTPVTTTATAYTTILSTTIIPITISIPSTVTETLERTVEKLITATQILTKAETTILDRMTTPTIIGLIAAGTLLAITTLLLRR